MHVTKFQVSSLGFVVTELVLLVHQVQIHLYSVAEFVLGELNLISTTNCFRDLDF